MIATTYVDHKVFLQTALAELHDLCSRRAQNLLPIDAQTLAGLIAHLVETISRIVHLIKGNINRKIADYEMRFEYIENCFLDDQ